MQEKTYWLCLWADHKGIIKPCVYYSGTVTGSIGSHFQEQTTALYKLICDCLETFEKCPILPKAKEGENFNHRNTFSILRIKI